MEIYKRERKVNIPNSRDPISLSLDFSLDSSQALSLSNSSGSSSVTRISDSPCSSSSFN